MSAICIDMRTRQRIPTPMESDEDFARRLVLEKLRGKVTGNLLAQAQLRAVRAMQLERTTAPKAAQRAIAWAMCEDDKLPPPAAA